MLAAIALDSLWCDFVIQLTRVRNRVAQHTPTVSPTDGMRLAGVTVLLRSDIGGPELLLIERARREGDPWSGHMAFPGGRADPADPSVQKTAERETLEEVGITLEDIHYVGRLDDLSGRGPAARQMVVSAYVYSLDDPGRLEIDRGEVADAFWVSLDHLKHPDNHVHYPMQYGGREVVFPGINVGERRGRVVWGLTYHFLERFFEIIGNPLPDHGIPVPELQAKSDRS